MPRKDRTPESHLCATSAIACTIAPVGRRVMPSCGTLPGIDAVQGARRGRANSAARRGARRGRVARKRATERLAARKKRQPQKVVAHTRNEATDNGPAGDFGAHNGGCHASAGTDGEERAAEARAPLDGGGEAKRGAEGGRRPWLGARVGGRARPGARGAFPTSFAPRLVRPAYCGVSSRRCRALALTTFFSRRSHDDGAQTDMEGGQGARRSDRGCARRGVEDAVAGDASRRAPGACLTLCLPFSFMQGGEEQGGMRIFAPSQQRSVKDLPLNASLKFRYENGRNARRSGG